MEDDEDEEEREVLPHYRRPSKRPVTTREKKGERLECKRRKRAKSAPYYTEIFFRIPFFSIWDI